MSPAAPACAMRKTRYTVKNGSMICTRMRPGCLLMSVFGRDDGGIARVGLKVFEEELARAGFLVTFVDAREERGTSSPMREQVLRWYWLHKGRWRSCHVLISSKFIEMTLAILNLNSLSSGFFQMYSDLGAFERAIAREVPGFTRLPTFETEIPTVSV